MALRCCSNSLSASFFLAPTSSDLNPSERGKKDAQNLTLHTSNKKTIMLMRLLSCTIEIDWPMKLHSTAASELVLTLAKLIQLYNTRRATVKI